MNSQKKPSPLQFMFLIVLMIISIYGYEYFHLITHHKAVQTDAQFMEKKHPINFHEYIINVVESDNNNKYIRLRILGSHENGMIRLAIVRILYDYSLKYHDDKLAVIANHRVLQENDERFIQYMHHAKERYESDKIK